MRGQVLFFDAKKHFGIIRVETGEQVFLSGHELAELVGRNDWVAFDAEPNFVSGTKCDWVAKNVQRIGCPPEYLLQGTVKKFFPDLGYGFIKYENDGETQSMFFHVSDLLRVEGVEPVPCVGCKASFCLGQKAGRQVAAQIWIEQWPESEPSVEQQFAAAEELPLDIPEPVTASVAFDSVLTPATKNLTLLEIIQQRRTVAQR